MKTLSEIKERYAKEQGWTSRDIEEVEYFVDELMQRAWNAALEQSKLSMNGLKPDSLKEPYELGKIHGIEMSQVILESLKK